MLDKLTLADFEAHRGETFELLGPDGQTIALRLTEINSHGTRAAEGQPASVTRLESFSVVFEGPNEWVISQGLVELSNTTLGTLPALFLVPVAQNENGRYYEAVFN